MLRTVLSLRGLAAASMLLACAAALAQTYAVDAIDGGLISGLSSDGRAAVGQDFDYGSFRWTPEGGFVSLGRNPYLQLGVGGGMPRISGDGQVIASTMLSNDGSYATSGRWTVGGGWTALTPPLPPTGGIMDNSDSSVFGLSRDGLTVTGLFWRPGASDGSAHGSAWSAASNMLDMGSSGNNSRIDAASADGQVLAGWDESPSFGNRRAAVWDHGVRSVLLDSDYNSEASAINGGGGIVVGYAPDARKRSTAAMWRKLGARWLHRSLGVVPGTQKGGYAGALGVTDNGDTVVGYSRPDPSQFGMVGFVWTQAGGMMTAAAYLASLGVVIDGVKITQVTAVTPDGKAMAMVGQTDSPPIVTRSYIVRRVD